MTGLKRRKGRRSKRRRNRKLSSWLFPSRRRIAQGWTFPIHSSLSNGESPEASSSKQATRLNSVDEGALQDIPNVEGPQADLEEAIEAYAPIFSTKIKVLD